MYLEKFSLVDYRNCTLEVCVCVCVKNKRVEGRERKKKKPTEIASSKHDLSKMLKNEEH